MSNLLADMIAAGARSQQGERWLWATVWQISPLRVIEDGAAGPINITPKSLTPVAVGDRVLCLRVQRRLIVIGKMGGQKQNPPILDTRNDDQPPSYYYGNYSYSLIHEMKDNSALGLPTGRNRYQTLSTYIPWRDTSIPIFQTAQSGADEKLVRYSTSRTAWSPWKSENASNVIIIGEKAYPACGLLTRVRVSSFSGSSPVYYANVNIGPRISVPPGYHVAFRAKGSSPGRFWTAERGSNTIVRVIQFGNSTPADYYDIEWQLMPDSPAYQA